MQDYLQHDRGFFCSIWALVSGVPEHSTNALLIQLEFWLDVREVTRGEKLGVLVERHQIFRGVLAYVGGGDLTSLAFGPGAFPKRCQGSGT
jgi:hypothetical protein